MWLISALIGYILLAIVFILDKHILAQEVKRPVVYTFYSCVFLLAVGIAWLFVPFETSLVYWFWSIVAGFAFGLALHLMFVAVSKSEASHLDPFIGAIITIATFAGAYLWLGETLTAKQGSGIICLGIASLLLAVEGKVTKNAKRWPAYLIGVLAGILFAISALTGKFLYDEFGFVSGLVGSRFTTGIFGLLILLLPSAVKALRAPASKTAKNPAGLVILDKILGVVAVLFIQYAISKSSVTVVSALAGLQYALMFAVIVILTWRNSKFLKEKFSLLETTAQVAGLILIMIGLYLVV